MRILFSALLFLLVTNSASAGLFQIHGKGCSDGCPKLVCEPVIARPTCTTIFNHQRRICATKCCSQEACGPASCCAPTACLESDCSAPELFCPAEPSCSAPQAACCVESGCGDGCGCRSGAACYSAEDCQVIAHLIHQSMTGCYASIRRKAVHRLGDHFDCVCHPEIMTAFIHALNDSDESVRAKAADEIGDQIRRNRVCIGAPTVEALQRALADCDRAVRRESEAALRLAGYRVVDGACCSTTTNSHLTTPQLMPTAVPPQIHPEVSNDADVPSLELLPEESQLSTELKANTSLKVLPVSTRLVSRLKPITDSLRYKKTVQAFDAAVPPPVPPQEPEDFAPATADDSDFPNPKSRRGLMRRLFGELRN